MKQSSHSPVGASHHAVITHRGHKKPPVSYRKHAYSTTPKHIRKRELAPHLSARTRFHIPVLHKHVVSRSEVSVNNNALQSEAASRVRERRHLPGAQEVLLIDAVQDCLFSSSFYQPIMASTGRRLGSLDALKSRSTAIMPHRTSGEIIPGISFHTCPLIFTSQRELV